MGKGTELSLEGTVSAKHGDTFPSSGKHPQLQHSSWEPITSSPDTWDGIISILMAACKINAVLKGRT